MGKKDPKRTAEQILSALGGKENIVDALHCATRLRVTLKDASKADFESVKKADNVAGYYEKTASIRLFWEQVL